MQILKKYFFQKSKSCIESYPNMENTPIMCYLRDKLCYSIHYMTENHTNGISYESLQKVLCNETLFLVTMVTKVQLWVPSYKLIRHGGKGISTIKVQIMSPIADILCSKLIFLNISVYLSI